MKLLGSPLSVRALAAMTSFSAALAFTGCGEIARIQECNTIVEVINNGSSVLKEVNTAKDLDARAAEIEAFEQRVAAVKVERKELQGFVGEYRKLLTDVAAYARDMKTATDYGAVERRSKELAAREKDLLERMHAFCRG